MKQTINIFLDFL